MATVEIPDDLASRLRGEADAMGVSVGERLGEILGPALAPPDNLNRETVREGLAALKQFLGRIPAVGSVAVSTPSEPYWWAKFAIAIDHPLAWRVVQELGHVLNYLSLEERLPTVFMPVSPPPYLNGGPQDFLSWVIEAKIPFLNAGAIAGYLEGRLPQPVEDPAAWQTEG